MTVYSKRRMLIAFWKKIVHDQGFGWGLSPSPTPTPETSPVSMCCGWCSPGVRELFAGWPRRGVSELSIAAGRRRRRRLRAQLGRRLRHRQALLHHRPAARRRPLLRRLRVPTPTDRRPSDRRRADRGFQTTWVGSDRRPATRPLWIHLMIKRPATRRS